MAVSKRLRYEILRRDNHACRYCGQVAPDVKLTVDHVVPTALGGTDDPSNLVTACADCNSGKSATPPGAPLVDDVATDAARWAAAMQAAADLARQQRAAREKQRDAFLDIVLAHLGDWATPHSWAVTCDQMLDAGLELDDIEEAARAAGQQPRQDDWRYFCGVAWNLLRQRQSVARSLLAATEDDA